MGDRAMTQLLAGAALILAAGAFPETHAASGAQQAAEVDIVATATDQYNRMTVPVQIGDDGPFRFLIDTGSQNTVLASSIAAQMSLAPSGTATVVGIAGREQVDTVRIDEIGLGRRSYYGLTAPLLDRSDIGADGIVGIDGLQDQRVLLDFAKGLMAIGDSESLGGDSGFEIVVRARRKSGQLIMTNAVMDGVQVDVVIDTGAESSIGNLALQRAMSRNHSGDQAVLTSVTGQQVTADIGFGRQLNFGGLQLRNVAIAFTDAPPFSLLDLNKRPAMLLGMRELRLFKRVAIDFATRKVMFDLPSDTVDLPRNF
jgi:predicted aspartyl protease